MSAVRVALIGSRGVPASYGGYETLMEELGPRLVERGFEVTVYCRSHHTPARLESYRGMRLVVLPTIRRKYLDTPLHTLLSVLHAGSQPFHAALVVNSANALFVPLLRAADVPTALNVDGIEKRRAKWGWPGRSVYALSERLATRVADTLITDAKVIAGHYLARYGARSEVITYGVDAQPVAPGETLRRLGLQPRRYFLYVSRFEPENNPHRVAQAYRRVGGDLPLVMVGGAPYANRFINALTADADPRILFPGPIYGRGYRELLSSALTYIQATEVGGTHPALVEAMGYGAPLLCLDTPEHREVAADCARYFTNDAPETLTDLLDAVLADPAAALQAGTLGAQRAREYYSWELVADRYALVLGALADRARP